MSFTTIPNSGPFNDDRFDALRRDALMALVEAGVNLPPAVTAYFAAIEHRLLDATFQHKKDFMASSWAQFTKSPT